MIVKLSIKMKFRITVFIFLITGVAAVPVPDETKPLDGISYFLLLAGTNNYPVHPVYQHFPHHQTWNLFQGASTIRVGDWKLVWKLNNDVYELYNLQEDFGESKDLASKHTEKADAMKVQHFAWLKKTNSNLPRIKQFK